jgi:ribosome-associated toxin RatA of RatAB toxin-antitoxin module
MPIVETSVWINAPRDHVYAVAKDVESFPEFMADVKSINVLEREGSRIVSEWVGIVPQFMLKVRWTQEDNWNDAEYRDDFKQVKGDYDKLEGYWTFTEENGGTRFDSWVDYEYKVPTLGALISKVIHGIVVKNLENVQIAIKARAEQQ